MTGPTSSDAVMGRFQTRGSDFLHFIDASGNVIGGMDKTGAGFGASTGGIIPPPSKILYVDIARTDSYTANGSVLKPFKTIMAAINQVIANGDNNNTDKIYTIQVNQGQYPEQIVLENTALVALNFVANGVVALSNPTSSLKSTANNNNLNLLSFTGFNFNSITLTCSVNNNSFLNQTCNFVGCTFSQNITVTAAGLFGLIGSQINTLVTIQLTNVGSAFASATMTSGSPMLNLITDTSQPAPSNLLGGTYFQGLWSSLLFGTVSIDGPNVGSQMDIDVGTILGKTTSTVTIGNGALLRNFHGSTVSAPITVNAGGEYRSLGGVTRSVVTNSGTYSQQGNLAILTMLLGGANFSTGTGSPNGVVVGSPPDVYLNKSGGAATTWWVKESGVATNSGWVGK